MPPIQHDCHIRTYGASILVVNGLTVFTADIRCQYLEKVEKLDRRIVRIFVPALSDNLPKGEISFYRDIQPGFLRFPVASEHNIRQLALV